MGPSRQEDISDFTAEAGVLAGTVTGPARTLRGDALRRLKKNKLALAGLAWIIIVILIAVTADLWAPFWLGDPIEIDSSTMTERTLLSPSLDHPFGTDKLGRDVASRVVYGARVSLIVGVLAVAIMVVIGLLLGAIAAYYGGVWDALIMRTADVFFAFPYILFAIVLIALLGKGFQNVFIAIGILGWPSIARVFRSSILSVKSNEYVDAARAMGASTRRILIRHIMPNSVAPIIVYGTMSVGGAILAEAALSFLGMGVQPPSPSWGLMLSEARSFMLSAPWLMIYPGIAILTTVLAFVLLGDGLRDALDVKLKE
ncbi:MAG: peptide ABC transporter permease [Actinobacteria bacterium RBG_16_64_13]|nr:MAG: peptide ABC transporter permease [Actinobacteria bacterium RBG_16_64_13]